MSPNNSPAPRANAGSRANLKAERNLNRTSSGEREAGGARPGRARKPQALRASGAIDFAEINRAALASFPAVLARILPEEKRVGAEIVALRKARAVGRALGDKAQSLRLDRQKYLGNDPGPVEWSSRLEQRGDYRWFLPRVELVGKLGQAGGPSLEQVPPESPASPPPARPASRRRLERGRR